MKEVRIGFWKSETEKDLPLPKPTTERRDQNKVVKALRKAIEAAKEPNRTSRVIARKGSSICRVCGHRNGSCELEIVKGRTKYIIPEGYLHYLQDHGVGYDLRLIRALGINLCGDAQ